jgi:hypothetical protein
LIISVVEIVQRFRNPIPDAGAGITLDGHEACGEFERRPSVSALIGAT